MGYYIETPPQFLWNKADYIMKEHGAVRSTVEQARQAFTEGKGVVCVVSNGAWDAAGFMYSQREFDEFANTERDHRPRTWLVMDRDKAETLSGYRKQTA